MLDAQKEQGIIVYLTNIFMHELFDICVDILNWIAEVFGITYKEANIWIFVIIEPIVFVLMAVIIAEQWRRIITLNSEKLNRKR